MPVSLVGAGARQPVISRLDHKSATKKIKTFVQGITIW
jgi:hypothetical protein